MSCPFRYGRVTSRASTNASTIFAVVYGGIAYTAFGASFVWLIAFVFNLAGPFSVDRTATLPWPTSLAIDLALLTVFGLQHTVMARVAFKRRWTVICPAHLERSTYVILSSLLVVLLIWFWQPLPGVLLHVTSDTARFVLFGFAVAGWLLVVATSFQIDHWHLLGLRQVWTYGRGQPAADPGFVTPLLYRIVRHPMMIGYFLGFWATPDMTVSHFALAAGMTAYIFLAIPFEEADLAHELGASYRAYQNRVPRLLPRLFRHRHSSVSNH